MEQSAELREAFEKNSKNVEGLTDFEEGFLIALDPDEKLMDTLENIKKSDKMIEEAKKKCQESSSPDDMNKGIIAGLESWDNYYDTITLENKKKIFELAFDQFCMYHGINYGYLDRVISYDDDDLDKIDNAIEVYKFAQEYAYKKEIHLKY